MMDVALIRQALSNLIDNAFKYGNEHTSVNIEAFSINNLIEISVTNVGVPIPQEAIEKIFDRFYRADNTRTGSTGGMGLGLSVVKSIMELHKGSVKVESMLGDITKISILLPQA
jgi:signal transduction histidine kinase